MRRHALLPLVALAVATTATPVHAANDGGFSQQWHMHAVGAEPAWATGTGEGITIAVVDTGVHLQHEDLRNKVLPGWDFVHGRERAQDDNGHGTHVAGVAAAATNNQTGVVGVAPGARILPVKVLSADGTGTIDHVTKGIRWAVDNGAAVVNVSLGVEVGNRFVSVPVSGPVLAEAIRYASTKGAICVIAAGNSGTPISSFAREDAVVVGATDREDRMPGYSNSVGDAKWGMVAPGGSGATEPSRSSENVLSTYWVNGSDKTYAWSAGTSMAAPHVAGAAAILRGLGLTPLQTVDRLRSTAKDIGDADAGDGRLDVAKAVAGLRPTTSGGATGTSASTTTTTRRRTAATTPRGGAGGTATTGTSPPGVGAAASDGGTGGPLVTVDPLSPPGEANGDSEGEGGDTSAAGSPRGGRGRSGGGDGNDGLPWAPPLGAAALLAAAVEGLRRARRV